MRLTVSLVTIWLLTGVPASGDLIPRHDPLVIANGSLPQDGFNLTYDRITRLDWLDANLSSGRGISDVRANLAAGGDYGGFRFATRSELETLLLHLGLAPIGVPQDPDVSTAIAMLGRTIQPFPLAGYLSGSVLIVDEVDSDADDYLGIGIDDWDQVSGRSDFVGAVTRPIDWIEQGDPTWGFALVRAATIPEPASYALAVSIFTFAAMTAQCRRIKQRRGLHTAVARRQC